VVVTADFIVTLDTVTYSVVHAADYAVTADFDTLETLAAQCVAGSSSQAA
jgi:hypothetical protein